MIPNRIPAVLRWIVKHQLKNSMGERFEFETHPFLQEPLMDWHPNQGVNKSAQVGWSETIGAVKSFYGASVLGLNIIYTLPDDKFAEEFVSTKINPIVEGNKRLRGFKGGHIKKIKYKNKQRNIFFMGTHITQSKSNQEEASGGVSKTADLLIHDERSRSNAFMVSQMQSRIDNSLYKGTWSFDNPVYPGVGSDAVWLKSDQKHWMVPCGHCKYWGYMDWKRLDKFDFRSGSNHHWVDPDKKIFVCGKCRKVITDYDRLCGRWVSKFPSVSDYRGYWLSQLCYIRHNVSTILKKEEDPENPVSQFYNFTLGQPYIGSDVKVSRSDILRNCDGETNSLVGNAMGVDQDKKHKWYTILNNQGMFLTGFVKTWDEIETIFNKYEATMVVDSLPYPKMPKEFVEKYPGRAFRALYKPEADQVDVYKFSDKIKGLVLIRREEAIDEIVDEIMSNSFPIQVPESELEEYTDHWESIVRVITKDRNDNDRYIWQKINPDDHLVHTTVYAKAALKKATRYGGVLLKPKRKATQTRDGVMVSEEYTQGQDVLNELLQEELRNMR